MKRKTPIKAKKSLSPDNKHSFVHVSDFAKLDTSRQERTSIPEVIYCENKSFEQIVTIARTILSQKEYVLGTRCPHNYFPKLEKTFPNGKFLKEARAFRIGKSAPKIQGCSVGIISAGTTDLIACEEAALVLESLGIHVQRIYDVGVAGIHRLLANDSKIKDIDVLIVAAGMEGALPSVVAGLYPQPIIALPTSIGYGTAL